MAGVFAGLKLPCPVLTEHLLRASHLMLLLLDAGGTWCLRMLCPILNKHVTVCFCRTLICFLLLWATVKQQVAKLISMHSSSRCVFGFATSLDALSCNNSLSLFKLEGPSLVWACKNVKQEC